MSNILASHINLYTSPVFYHFNLETPQRPFHNVHSEFSIYLNTTETHPFPLKSPVQFLQPRGCPTVAYKYKARRSDSGEYTIRKFN